MQEIGLFEAKTNLSKIAERVKQTGRSVTFTKRGEPYVDLVPHSEESVQQRPQGVVLAELEQLCRVLPKSSFKQLKADIEDGRR
jgi:prevent-host-death family protein